MMTTIVLIKMTFCQQMISDVVWLAMTNISRWFSGAFVKSWERLLPLIISKHQFSPSRREDDNDEIMSDEENDLNYYDDDTDSEIRCGCWIQPPTDVKAQVLCCSELIPSHPAVLLKCPFAVKSCQGILLIYRPQVTCLMCDSLQAMSNSFYAYWAMGE